MLKELQVKEIAICNNKYKYYKKQSKYLVITI